MTRYTVSEHEQGTDGWLQDRAGRLNGSEVAAIYATIKTGEAAARRDLRLKLVLERITGKPQRNDFVSADMQWGTDHEHANRQRFEAATRLLVEEVGYCKMTAKMAGCSPDGFVEQDGVKGIVEFKCPKSATHLGYLNDGEVPRDYLFQITHNLWVTDAQFCHFQSFDPRFPESMQVFRKLVKRAELDMDAHERAVLQFLAEVERDTAAMRSKFGV